MEGLGHVDAGCGLVRVVAGVDCRWAARGRELVGRGRRGGRALEGIDRLHVAALDVVSVVGGENQGCGLTFGLTIPKPSLVSPDFRPLIHRHPRCTTTRLPHRHPNGR